MAKGKPITVEYQTLLIIWLSLLSSQVLFFALVYFLKPELFTFDVSRSPFAEQPFITLAFAAIAVVFFVLSIVLSRQHMRRAVEDQDAGCVQTGLLLGCALAEISTLLGVLLAFAFDHPYFYLWIVLGIVGILIHFPRKGSLAAATGTAV
jgi:hypothetical protein